MLLIHLLNNFQQECFLRQMDRLLEKHPDAIDAFIVDFSSMMFAKENELTVASNNLMLLIHLLNNFQQQCLLRQMDRLLEKQPDAIDAFIEDFSSIMFAKKNKLTVGLTP